MFGIQICTFSKIVNYSEANHLWIEINAIPSGNWLEDYYKKYKKSWNALKSGRQCSTELTVEEFRKAAGPLHRNKDTAEDEEEKEV